jgi:hypothetical protein
VTKNQIYVGIDGEGQTIKGNHGTTTIPGRHKYVLLAVADDKCNNKWYVENMNGLSTIECFEFLLSLPNNLKFFAYAFNYDLTKILEDIDNETLYKLFRPELRKSKKGRAIAVEWNGYYINLMGTRFSLKKDDNKIVINDIFKFFQGKFTSALKDWKAAPTDDINRIESMKIKRPEFDKLDPDKVREYCFDECQYMAVLAKKLIQAHIDAGIPLKAFNGAGSSASSMLSIMGIKSNINEFRKLDNKELEQAVASAYFGGRFENSKIGPIPGLLHSWDISSAYPYQIYKLPCLIHGKWRHSKNINDIIEADSALVRYRLNKPNIKRLWAPFPFRTTENVVVCPEYSEGGWLWKDEFLVGQQVFDNVEFIEAYIYNTPCTCHPFKKIAEYYTERCRIGKEGPGIVLKLGCNSVYGKLAQSRGGWGAFTNWIWAGMITSGCRAQILELFALHNDINNILMIATDGIVTTEDIRPPTPIDTNTSHTGKPLGGWEYKPYKNGLFFARPGIYFPLDISEGFDDIKTIRARGIGREVLAREYPKILDGWNRRIEKVALPDVNRFIGAKSSISKSLYSYNRRPEYGQWDIQPRDTSFDPMPKRRSIIGNILSLRNFEGLESIPYTRAFNPEGYDEADNVFFGSKTIREEQPDLELHPI